MLISEFFFRCKEKKVTSREFHHNATPCPDLRSFPGVINNTSRIWENVLDLAKLFYIKKGTVIYPEHEKSSPLLYIKNGKLCIYMVNEHGDEFSPHFIFSGTLVNEAFWLLKSQLSYNPIKAIEDCEIYSFDNTLTFEDIASINPMFIKNIIYSQSVKNILYSKLSYINAQKIPLLRITLFIIELYNLYNTPGFYHGLTQAEIADLLHIHSVTVSNTLSSRP